MRRELELSLRILSVFRHELPIFRLLHMFSKNRMLSTDTTRGNKLEAELSNRFGPMTSGNIGNRNQREPILASPTAKDSAELLVPYLFLQPPIGLSYFIDMGFNPRFDLGVPVQVQAYQSAHRLDPRRALGPAAPVSIQSRLTET